MKSKHLYEIIRSNSQLEIHLEEIRFSRWHIIGQNSSIKAMEQVAEMFKQGG